VETVDGKSAGARRAGPRAARQTFVTYVLTLTGYYMLAVQVMLMLPIMVNDIAGPCGRQMDVRH
jgi:hypothetical protein